MQPNILQITILGIVQGLTEFIPVSSSGHLEIIPYLLGWPDLSTITILFAHFGTLLALLLYFRRDLLGYAKALWHWARRTTTHEDRVELSLIAKVLLATIPAGVAGLILEDEIEKFYTSSGEETFAIVLTAAAMLIVGVLFILEHRLLTNKKDGLTKLTIADTVVIGISQAFALLRGVSRSGITILIAESRGIKRADAAKFSFLMSIPVMLATSVYATYSALSLPMSELQNELVNGLVILVTSFVSGYFAVKFLLRFLENNSLSIFGWYRVVFALGVLFVVLA